MRAQTRRGIVADLVLLITATLLPLLLLNGYLAYRNIRETRAAALVSALSQARDTAARADSLVSETQSLLIGLARTPTLRGGNPDEVRTLLREIKVRYPYFDDLLAINAQGTIYVSAASLYVGAIGNIDQDHGLKVLRGEQIATSTILLSQATGRPVVLIGVPIYANASGGTPIGEIAAALDLLLLQQWLDNRSLGTGTTITVIDNQGARVLARSDDPESWVGRTLADMPTVQTAIREEEGVVDGATLADNTHFSAFTTARLVPWTVLVDVPNEMIDAPLRREIGRMVLRLGLTSLVVIVLAVVGSRRIVGPLQRLTGGALTIARGDLDHRLTAERQDEVGQVAGAVNQMADELVGSIDALQQTQERLEGAVSQVGRALTSTTEAPALFAGLVEAACALTRSEAGALTFQGGAPPVTSGEPFLSSALLVTLTAEYGRAQPERPGALLQPLERQVLQRVGMHQHLAVLVQTRGERLGTLHVFRRQPRPYGVDDARLLRAFADQAAIAIEQERLRREVAEASALRRLHQLQSEFLTTAAHELRAPVTSIKSYAELLLRDDLTLDPAMRRDCLAGIDRLADRLTAQVRAFFDAMRAESGQLAFRCEPLDLAELTGAVVRDFTARSPAHLITLVAPTALPAVLADRARVEDVLTNLLDNAVKYSPLGGPIEVALVMQPHAGDTGEAAVRVTVRDAGIGIPVAEQAHIFARFYRLDHTTTRQVGGIGLGLYLCRAYIEGMGGTITVASQRSDGTTFAFTLPVAATVSAQPPAPVLAV